MTATNSNGWKNYLLTILGTFFVTVTIGWATLGRNVVSRADVMTQEEHKEQIKRESPYMEDRKLLLATLDNVPEMNRRLGVIERELSALKALVRRTLEED